MHVKDSLAQVKDTDTLRIFWINVRENKSTNANHGGDTDESTPLLCNSPILSKISKICTAIVNKRDIDLILKPK